MTSTPPTRRTNGATASKLPPSHSPPPPSTTSSPTPLPTIISTLLPTPPELLLLLTYPLTLTLGSLYSLLSPTTRHAPYDPLTQSHPTSHAPSYFALKHNILNDYFVKVAWFWVTLAYAWFLALSPTTGPTIQSKNGWVLTPQRLRGILRWVLVTTWWALVTQWCFGPGLIDRGFRVTGGVCKLSDRLEGKAGSGRACKALGGEWRGGHDISGHVFILVLGSAFLGFEGWLGKGRVDKVHGEGSVGGDEEEEEGGGSWGMGMPLVVMGFSWWMLLMTAAFFHTWFEKFTGLLTAYAGIFVVYFLPKAIPAMRNVVGIPGT
ncbi:hypothetical protein ACLMJK_008983 [Lecanora helva]